MRTLLSGVKFIFYIAEEGRRKKEEGRRKKEEGSHSFLKVLIISGLPAI